MTSLKHSFLALSLLVAFAAAGTGCGGSGTPTLAATSPGSGSSGSSGGSSGSSGSSGSAGSSGSSTASASGITVTAPASGAAVGSPFNLVASATTCSAQSVTSIGYSLDSSTDFVVASGNTLNTPVSAQTGTHIVHVKSWGTQAATCDQDVPVAVIDASSPEKAVVPSGATVVSNIQARSGWRAAHDPGTGSGSSSSGWMSMVSSPSMSGDARRFSTSFSDNGGESYNVDFANDPNATNFFYDGWVYLTSSASNMANLEMDMYQVMDNGWTVIYGFQCDGYSSTWDYTANRGTPTHPVDEWVHTGAHCNVQNWARNTWHHVQVSYSRNDDGVVTYHAVWLDGAESQINATAPSAFALGWGQVLLTNFQMDGRGSGSNSMYLDDLAISRW